LEPPLGGITKATLLGYGTQADGFNQFKRIIEKYVDKYITAHKFFLVGYNCQSFDMAFLRALFERNGDTYFGSWF
jgi:DNA polymerase-3 subunit epsilon